MCGISAVIATDDTQSATQVMVARQRHRGPDASGLYTDPSSTASLGHNRLSIIDLSEAGQQPMASADGRYWIVFNGEIYNYLELRAELADYPYSSQTDTEVVLAAYQRWGESCLDRFLGMFAFLIWDQREQRLFGARDRFGVKPLHFHCGADESLYVASEIKALHAAGVPAEPDLSTWASYLTYGTYGHHDRTFWEGIRQLPAGHTLTWQGGTTKTHRWYDLAARTGDSFDTRSDHEVAEAYLNLLRESVRLRFRADVPVGINLSGGLDSATLLGLVHNVQGKDSSIRAFTFTTGDDQYDETPWVKRMLMHTQHPWTECRLRVAEVPNLVESVQAYQDEPFGGLPTIAYAQLFSAAKKAGVSVLLDGQGMDEQWAGYDYYAAAATNSSRTAEAGTVQGTREPATRAECLLPEFRAMSESPEFPAPYPDALRNLQYRDLNYTKLPRALRFNDRVSMQASTELREPFLDHRLIELAMRQPVQRKIRGSTHKWLLRCISSDLLPNDVVEAPKRALQTPQREWVRGPLRQWAEAQIDASLDAFGGRWLDERAVRRHWQRFQSGQSDNSFYIWQWISLGALLSHSLVTQHPG